MMQKKRVQLYMFIMILLQMWFLCGCAPSDKIIFETNEDSRLFMDVSDYTDNFERTITIKNTQNCTFSVELSPSAGNIEISITDGSGDVILCANEQTMLNDSSSTAEVVGGNGTYKIIVRLKKYSGSFDVSWNVSE